MPSGITCAIDLGHQWFVVCVHIGLKLSTDAMLLANGNSWIKCSITRAIVQSANSVGKYSLILNFEKFKQICPGAITKTV